MVEMRRSFALLPLVVSMGTTLATAAIMVLTLWFGGTIDWNGQAASFVVTSLHFPVRRAIARCVRRPAPVWRAATPVFDELVA